MPFSPSPYQQAYFTWIVDGEGNVIIEAVAGSGKTTTIVEGIKLMLSSASSIFVGAYNNKMAKELAERVVGMAGVVAGTFHSAGFRALRFAFGKRHALKVDANKCKNIANSIANPETRPDLVPLVSTVVGAVSMAKQRGIGALFNDDLQTWLDMIDQFGLDENLEEDVDMAKLVKFCQVVLNRSNDDLEVIDFDDMVYLPIKRGIRMLQYDWVLIDEAQDTNPTRRALARKMLKPGGRLVAVGDPRQAIFGFTGADNDALDQIARDFGCARLPLSVTYRCPKAVVKHAQRWVNHIVAHESAPDGIVREVDFKVALEEIKVGDAVLCRYNKYIVALCFKLIRKGIPARIEGRSIGDGLVALAGRWKVKTLDALDKRLDTYLEREVAKALAKDNQAKAERITDQVETLRVLMDNAREQNIFDVAGLKDMVSKMFGDAVSSGSIVTLCSIHRSKGLEWKRVWLLGRSELMPSPMARRPWQVEQEMNLIYVAVTRAQAELIEVTGVKEALEDRKAAKKVEPTKDETQQGAAA